jgi:hypothetical protein
VARNVIITEVNEKFNAFMDILLYYFDTVHPSNTVNQRELKKKKNTNSLALVCKQTILTEQLALVDQDSANFC